MNVTEWYEPQIKPVHIGVYEIQVFDASWPYEYLFWFDGEVWRNEEGGYVLWDQNLTWRGMTSEKVE